LTIASSFEILKTKFIHDFIVDDRWQYLTKGLGNTLIITLFAVILGILLGFLVAVVRTTYDRRGQTMPGRRTVRQKLSRGLWWFFNAICRIYLTVIRGTPVVVQLLIINFIIFASVNVDKVLVAVLAFGINSGAYVAEIVRSGIMSVDQGQFEAGRSLGLELPADDAPHHLSAGVQKRPARLANEFIVL
jgi:ABC-type amino acid transport system permease subunit